MCCTNCAGAEVKAFSTASHGRQGPRICLCVIAGEDEGRVHLTLEEGGQTLKNIAKRSCGLSSLGDWICPWSLDMTMSHLI